MKKSESRRTLLKRIALGVAAIVVVAKLPARAGGGTGSLPPSKMDPSSKRDNAARLRGRP